jgi:methionine synthase I (cobalamin-dependent)
MQPDRTAELTALLRRRILVLDGAMGTQIQHAACRRPISGALPRSPSRAARRQRPARADASEVVRQIHDAYLAAGADIIETNTFSATRVAQADYHMEARRAPSTKPLRVSPASAPMHGPRARPTSRASSRARSARPIARRRSRPT